MALFDGYHLYIPSKWNGKAAECYTMDGNFQSRLQQSEAAYRENYSLQNWYDAADQGGEPGRFPGHLEGAAQ